MERNHDLVFETKERVSKNTFWEEIKEIVEEIWIPKKSKDD